MVLLLVVTSTFTLGAKWCLSNKKSTRKFNIKTNLISNQDFLVMWGMGDGERQLQTCQNFNMIKRRKRTLVNSNFSKMLINYNFDLLFAQENSQNLGWCFKF